MKCYVIGRSRHADIVLADQSVAPRHAELLVTADGRHHLTACGAEAELLQHSTNGWQSIRQSYLAPETEIRIGEYTTTLAALIALAEPRTTQQGRWTAEAEAETGTGGGTHNSGSRGGKQDSRMSGRVERDPETGEIIRRSP